MQLKTPLALVLLLLLVCARSAFAQANGLALGKESKAKEAMSIQLNLPVEFNYKTREAILNMRKREVAKYPMLLKSPDYTPSHPIFGAIEDGKPWWGLAGAGAFDSGPRSMLGFAEESRFVMNPFLLVAANPNATGIWNPALMTEKQMKDPAFPFFWMPESLAIDPQRAVGTVKYKISEYQKQIAQTGMLRGPVRVNRFSLVAYNARDFGLNYIYFNQGKSINVTNDNPTSEAVFIRQFIHCGGTCGCPGTCCNNMSPFIKEIDRLRINKLPARAVCYLFKEEPESPERAIPDMVFLLEFH